jgi:exopolysaccharide biosynthesis WecB/TagA/CpsF family protein
MSRTGLPSIAFFMHDLSGGGVEHMRLRLAAAFVARGHSVTIIVQIARGALRQQVPPDVTLVELGRARTWRSIVPLARFLRAQRPNVLFSSLDHNNAAALCARILAGRGTKIVICQHNAVSAEAASGWKYRVVPMLYRILAPWADAIIAVSGGVADDLAAATGLSRGRISVISNPVVSDQHQVPTAAPHEWLDDAAAIPVFLFVGRLVTQKNPNLLLRAFALRLRGGPARLILCGEGPLRDSLHHHAVTLGIADCVYFAGYVADPRAWMSYATALVVPSSYEGFGNVIVEALSCGTPVIATDCPHGPAEILAGGRFGWLVAVGDEQGLAAAMADNVRACFPAGRLVLRASGFSLFACVARHQMLINRLLDAGRREIFGLVFSSRSAAEISDEILRIGRPDAMRLLISQNVDTVRLLRARSDYAAASAAAWLISADGFPIATYTRMRGAGTRGRVTGCEIFHLLASVSDSSRRVLVVTESQATAECLRGWATERGLGSAWQATAAAAALLTDTAGQLRLAHDIAAFEPQILVMALGAPVSEIFLHRHAASLPPCWALCCGQAVRVELGLAKRAPQFWQSLNMEWAWRLMHEPTRLGPRYLRGLVSFPFHVWRDIIGSRRIKEGRK